MPIQRVVREGVSILSARTETGMVHCIYVAATPLGTCTGTYAQAVRDARRAAVQYLNLQIARHSARARVRK